MELARRIRKRKSSLNTAYAGWLRPAFTRFLTDGRACLTNNAAERSLRGTALGRKAWLFAGSHRGGDRTAFMYSLTWLELERDLSKEAARIIGDYEVPRDLREVIARDQLLTAERHTRLADVPAIEALVDRVQERLSKEDLALITSGDPSPLRSEIKDPALRATVASELKNEADLGNDPTSARRSEPVASFQDLARSQDRAADQRDRPRERDLSDSHEL